MAQIERRLKVMERWCGKWNIKPAPAKCELIVFSNSKREVRLAEECSLKLMNSDLNWKEEVKYLGVTYDKKNNWESHIKLVINKCYPKVLSICRLNRKMNYNNRKDILHIFESLILSCFYYSSMAYLNMNEKNWALIENFLIKSIKMIFDLPLQMNGERAREIFYPCTFREKIEIHALKRIAAMSNSTTIMQHQIFNCRDYAFTGSRDTIFERAMKISGINEAVNCYLCTMNCEHDCVRPF